MKNKKLLGISGRKRSGKSSVATLMNEILREEGKQAYKEKAYATLLKKFCSEITGIPIDGWETEEDKDKLLGPEWTIIGENGEKIQLTRRKCMQRFGSDACTAYFHPNVWVNALFNDYVSYSAKGSDYEFEQSKWFVTDVRFMNEVESIQERDGYLIRVKRPSTDSHGDTHKSETALDNFNGWDFVIVNDGTYEELKDKVKKVLLEIGII